MRSTILFLTVAIVVGCSQRVTPEDVYSEENRERPLVTLTLPAPVDDPRNLRGEVVAPPEARAPLRSGVLFLFVRRAGQAGGPPLAVQRHVGVETPFAFEIGPADAMLPDVEFPEQVTIVARVDGDGDPLTSGAGDWTAQSAPVAPGTADVRLDLQRADG